MAASGSLFSQQGFARWNLNLYQNVTYKEFEAQGLTVSHFKGAAWFDSEEHVKTFSFLIKHKKFTFEQAFHELQRLDSRYLIFIRKGLSRGEMAGLEAEQLNIHLRYGIPTSELRGLDSDRLHALINLRHWGLTAEVLRAVKFFNDSYHLPLVFLFLRTDMDFQQALFYLQSIPENRIHGITYGLKKSDLLDLTDDQFEALLDAKQGEGLTTRAAVAGLDGRQLDWVKHWFHFGLTSDLARQYKPLLEKYDDNANINRDLIDLLGSGCSITEALVLMKEWTRIKIKAYVVGFSKEELDGLSYCHVLALDNYRTIKNNLCADDLRGKDWLKTNWHLNALGYLLNECYLTVKDALAEMEGLNEDQLMQLVKHQQRRGDVLDVSHEKREGQAYRS